MDITMPELNGLEAAKQIAKEFPDVRILILSMHANEEYVRMALQVGAAGYLLKGADASELELAIRSVARGEAYLSPGVSKQLVQQCLQGEKASPSCLIH
jgi:DNA-binding NarL/FixJ family response regulator